MSNSVSRQGGGLQLWIVVLQLLVMIFRKLTSHPLSPLSRQAGSPELAGFSEGDAPAEEVVVANHERIKHHFHRYVAALGTMDWATQPDSFRRCAGANLVRFPAKRQAKCWRSGFAISVR